MTEFRFGDFEFVCRYWEARNAWGHIATMYKGGEKLAEAKVRYYNRTWEMYTYQSAMRQALEDWYQGELASYLNEKRKGYGGRFPRGAKKLAEQNFVLEGYKEAYKAIAEGKQYVSA